MKGTQQSAYYVSLVKLFLLKFNAVIPPNSAVELIMILNACNVSVNAIVLVMLSTPQSAPVLDLPTEPA
jgi:hypothetical protein